MPRSLGLDGADWGRILRIGATWGREGVRVPEWSATARLASTYPGVLRPVDISFDSDESLTDVVEPWGAPLLPARFDCREMWFNPSAQLRAEVEVTERPSSGGCPLARTRKRVLRLSPYSRFSMLLPTPDGRFPFAAERRFVGAKMSDGVDDPFDGKDARPASAPPVEDSPSDLDIRMHGRRERVERIVVRSDHSSARVDLEQASRAYAVAFGAPVVQNDEGPVWREYRSGNLRIEVGRGLQSLTITSASCDLWSAEQVAHGRDEGLEDWIRTQSVAERVPEDRYRIRSAFGFGTFKEATIERTLDACARELWKVRWEKPECAAPRTTEELLLATCCQPGCSEDPKEPLVRLLDATTDNNFVALRELLSPSGQVRIQVGGEKGPRTLTFRREQLDAKNIRWLPTWADVFDFASVSCSVGESDTSTVVCDIHGQREFRVEYRSGYLHAIHVQTLRTCSH